MNSAYFLLDPKAVHNSAMQIGISLPHFRHLASREAIRRIAQHTEAVGLDSIWVSDHILLTDVQTKRFGAVFYEPIATLSYAAAITEKVQVGTTAIILPYRNPKVTAKQLSTIDALSGGRLIFGCAAGWSQEEFEALGVDFKGRGAVSDAYLRIIKRLWTQPLVDGMHFEPRPVQKPHPPIWIGGNSQRAIRRAVELGDCWHPTRPNADEIRAGKAHIRQIAERYGRKPDEIGITVREPFKIDEALPADRTRPFVGPRAHIIDSFHEFKELGVSHMVVDLFYSTSVLEDATLESMVQAMEVLAQDIRPKL
jgi:probable F420-dependent oxidoreductase